MKSMKEYDRSNSKVSTSSSKRSTSKLRLSYQNEPNYDPSYYEPKRIRTRFSKYLALFVLGLEMAVSLISLLTFDGFEECCDESIFYNNTDSPQAKRRWELAFFWTSVAFLVVVAIQVPLVFKGYNVAIFNPILGYSLAALTFYNTHITEAWIMFGLETTATICESIVLYQDHKFTKLCIQLLFCLTACAVTLYCFISLTKQGGYCIVDGRLESVFEESTCNMDCDGEEEECYVCDGSNGGTSEASSSSSCFIQIY